MPFLALFAAVLVLTFTFRSSTKLATAYGVAVTGTFLITTTLFLIVARAMWKWPLWRLLVVGVVFGLGWIGYKSWAPALASALQYTPNVSDLIIAVSTPIARAAIG